MSKPKSSPERPSTPDKPEEDHYEVPEAPFGEEERRRARERASGFGNVARRLMRAGAGAILDTKVVPELPKEVALYLLRLGEDLRDDILRIFGRELRRVLETMNLGEELQKILTSTSFEIKTEIRFIPNDQSVIKNIRKTKMRVKRVEKDGVVTSEEFELDGDEQKTD